MPTDTVSGAKLDAISLHELRHSYASSMVRNGAPLLVVAEALGLSGTRMVEKHYAHSAPSYAADTIRRAAPNLNPIGTTRVLLDTFAWSDKLSSIWQPVRLTKFFKKRGSPLVRAAVLTLGTATPEGLFPAFGETLSIAQG